MVNNTTEKDNGVAQWWAKSKLDHLIRLRHRSDVETQTALKKNKLPNWLLNINYCHHLPVLLLLKKKN